MKNIFKKIIIFHKFFKLFSKIWKYIFFEIKTDFFFEKKFFKFSQQKKNLENIFFFKNLDTNLFKNLGKVRFFFENLISIFFLQRVTNLRIFFNI